MNLWTLKNRKPSRSDARHRRSGRGDFPEGSTAEQRHNTDSHCAGLRPSASEL